MPKSFPSHCRLKQLHLLERARVIVEDYENAVANEMVEEEVDIDADDLDA
jgi:hypothetical protein